MLCVKCDILILVHIIAFILPTIKSAWKILFQNSMFSTTKAKKSDLTLYFRIRPKNKTTVPIQLCHTPHRITNLNCINIMVSLRKFRTVKSSIQRTCDPIKCYIS
jgi:hypothetical protein